ncbi:ABC transporter ATP-binding protein [Candidatus Riflebacteria bacterium]
MTQLAIKTKNLTKYFGKKAVVNDLALSVPSGKACGFLGPNGAGKTTTLRMLLGLCRPYTGEISLLGMESPTKIKDINRRVGSLIERPTFYADMSAILNLQIFGNIGSTVSDARIEEVLKLVGLWGEHEKTFASYSTGMAQRLGIAFSLLDDPDLIILDEPTSGLDPRGRANVREIIKKLIAHKEMTVFLSTHLLHEVEEICDWVCIIDEGRLVVQGQVDELLSKENEVFTIKVSEKEDFTAFFSSLDYVNKVTFSPSCYKLQAQKGSAPLLARDIIGKGINLKALIPEDKSLEDFFLKVTGNGV